MTPEGPPGTVTVSVAPGTSGPLAWYSSNDGDSTAQMPATGGLRVGIGLFGARSVENCTVMVEPAATLVPVGETDETVRAGGGLAEVAAAWLLCRRSKATNPPAARMRTTTMTVTITHRRGPFLVRTCSPDMPSGILQGRRDAQRRSSAFISCVISESRLSSVTLDPPDSRT